MGNSDREAAAFKILEENFPEEIRNEAYTLVLTQIGKFIEKNKLRKTDFPKISNSALYTLTLGLAKRGLASKPDDAEKYLNDQLRRMLSGGLNALEEIFNEIIR
jgi:hypothetical protein